MDKIGPRLKTLRARQGLSQRKLAALAGVSNATISLIEHGRTDPSMGLLKRILEAMGLSFSEFFLAEERQSEKYFFAASELSEISSGPISFLQVGSDLSDNQLQILYERYRPGAVFSYMQHDPFEPSFVVDVTEAWERKMAALAEYRSQLFQPGEERAEPPTKVASQDYRKAVEGRARHFGMMIGVSFGEPFWSRLPVSVDNPLELLPKGIR